MDMVDKLMRDLSSVHKKYKDIVNLIENPTTSTQQRIALYGQEFAVVMDIASIHEDLVDLLIKMKKDDPLRAMRLKKQADSYLMTEAFYV